MSLFVLAYRSRTSNTVDTVSAGNARSADCYCFPLGVITISNRTIHTETETSYKRSKALTLRAAALVCWPLPILNRTELEMRGVRHVPVTGSEDLATRGALMARLITWPPVGAANKLTVSHEYSLGTDSHADPPEVGRNNGSPLILVDAFGRFPNFLFSKEHKHLCWRLRIFFALRHHIPY